MSIAAQAVWNGPTRLVRPAHLELVHCGPRTSSHRPLLFLHGAYTGAWCWSEYFLPYFAQLGFSSYALSLRGHGASDGREQLASHSIEDYVDDLEEAIAHIDPAPVVIGHSMGGLVTQKYLERGSLPGVVLLASVPPHGIMGSAMNLAFSKPGLYYSLKDLHYRGQPPLEAVHEALFAGPVATDRLERYYALMQSESTRALWDMTLFNLPQVWRMQIPPLLVLAGERDLMVPPEQVAHCARSYGVECEVIAGMGHAMMLEGAWQKVAQRIADWLNTI